MFGKNLEQSSRAMSLLRFVTEWSGTQLFASGKLINSPYIVLECYQQSLSCDDWRSFCISVVSDIANDEVKNKSLEIKIRILREDAKPDIVEPEKKYYFPCKLIDSYNQRASLSLLHPSSLQDQIQSIAVQRKCDWCPNFDKKNFRPISIEDFLNSRKKIL